MPRRHIANQMPTVLLISSHRGQLEPRPIHFNATMGVALLFSMQYARLPAVKPGGTGILL